MKKLLKLTGLALVLFIGVLLFNTFTFKSQQLNVDPVVPIDVDDVAFNRLSQAIRFATISNHSGEISDSSAFINFHDFVQTSYPLIDSLLDKQTIELSLLYTWKGSNPDLQPLILMSHQDVVPIDESSRQDWVHEPFSGKVTDTEIWGRGTLDDKGTLLAILEAVEMLLTEQFQPERTIYLAFGHDEEVGGEYGAKKIAAHLKAQGVNALFTLDEGGAMVEGMVPGLDERMALINVAEKGYVSFELKVVTEGGHSSTPPENSTIEMLSRAIIALDDNQLPYKNVPPISNQIKAVGPHLPFGLKLVFANSWLFGKQILEPLKARTSTAPTIINGGFKDNVIPTTATATINFRVMPGETIESVKQHIIRTINNESIIVTTSIEKDEATPVSSTNSEGFELLATTIRQVFPEAIVVPGLLPGGTDSKHFLEISDDVYRFYPIKYTKEKSSLIHGLNERIEKDNYKECIQFVYQLVRNTNSAL